VAEAMEYPKFSFRISPEIGTKLEEEATKRELTTSELVREIVTTHYEKSAAPETSGTESVASADAERRFQQLVFEIGKTRSALLRIACKQSPRRRWSKSWPRLRTTPRTTRCGWPPA
jgi:hypothetical protein